MNSQEPAIFVTGLSKQFGEVRAVEQVSFDVEPGLGMRIIPVSSAKA